MALKTKTIKLPPNRMPDRDTFTIIVTETDSGKRLDSLVSFYTDQCSRKFAASLILKGTILVHDSIKKPGYRVKAGDRIHGYIPPPEAMAFEPEPIELDILFEDNDIIVINKKAGMVVHPAPGHYTGTLVNGLLYHYPDLKSIGGELRPGIVHRLDKDTSGVMVVAKHHDALLQLSPQFKSKKIDKRYLAVVLGEMQAVSGHVTLPIGRHPTDRKRMSTNSRKARSAETIWKVHERFNGLNLLELNIKTGRTHQIRVHCAAIQHPIVGDPVYCSRKAYNHLAKQKDIHNLVKAVPRQMLHAWRLGLTHPVSEKRMTFEAPLPDDMKKLIEALRGGVKG